MSSLGAIRTAMATTLQNAIAGLNGYPTVPESVNVPAAMVAPRETDFTQAFGRGVDEHTVDVIVLVGRTDDQVAQSTLDDYVNGFGSKSVRQAIWNAKSLGLGDTEATVTGMSDYGATFEVGGIDYVGARLAVKVLTSGTA
jgi:hypothetical protein